MIEWLCELNRYFGLQSESLYYSPLVQRIRAIELAADVETCNNKTPYACDVASRSNNELLLTGHSLGAVLVLLISDSNLIFII